jgi:Domain of unknown function (DUF4412)
MTPATARLVMRSAAVVVWGILAGTLAGACPAGAGWVIDQVVQEAGATSRQQLLFEADRMKTLMLDASGNPRVALIVDLTARTITQVDYHERRYVTATVGEHLQAAQQARQQGIADLGEVTKQIERDTQDLPPSERAAIEKMLRDQLKQAAAPTPDCRTPRTELRRTGRRAVIAGYEAVGYDLLADGKRDSEVWIAPGITAWRELDARKLEQFSSETAQLSPCGTESRRGVAVRKLAGEGFAVRTVVLDGATTQEVVRAEQRPVPAAEFEPPPGFERRPLALAR